MRGDFLPDTGEKFAAAQPKSGANTVCIREGGKKFKNNFGNLLTINCLLLIITLALIKRP